MKRLGALLLVTFVIHVTYHFGWRNEHYDFLWTCNVACAFLGVGCLLPKGPAARHLIAIGTSWLVYGLPVWIIGLLGGNELLPTAVVIHVGGVLTGTIALKKLGFPRGTWVRATAGLVILLGVSRLVTDPRENVNLVFRVFPGWETLFPAWRSYFLFLFSTGALTFAAFEFVAIKLLKLRALPNPIPLSAIAISDNEH